MRKRCISFILTLALAMTLMTMQGFALENTSECISIEEMNKRHKEACDLLDELRTLQLNKNRQIKDGVVVASANDDTKMQEIKEKLLSLGVREISQEELGVSSMARGVTIPTSPNESWFLAEYITTYQGIQYQVSDLIAQPYSDTSKLIEIGSGSLYTASGLMAGSANYLEIVVTSAVGALGTIGSVASTIYEVLKASISNLQTTTIIQNIDAVYMWQCETKMHFVYVKRIDSSAEPRLCYVYNDATVNVTGMTNSIQYNSTSQNNLGITVNNNAIDEIMNPGANNLVNAIDSFLNYSQIMHSFVDYVTIKGIDGKVLTKSYLCNDTMPGLIY